MDLRLTLRISPSTDVPLAIQKVERALAVRGVSNPSLSDLLMDTCKRFQSQLLDTNVVTGAAGTPNVSVGQTVIRGNGYRICVTTRPATKLSSLIDRLLPRTATIS